MAEETRFINVTYEEIVRETEKAILFKINDEEVWLPKSQIEVSEEGDNVVEVPEWLAEKNNLG